MAGENWAWRERSLFLLPPCRPLCALGRRPCPRAPEEGGVLSEVPRVTGRGKWVRSNTMQFPYIFVSLTITPWCQTHPPSSGRKIWAPLRVQIKPLSSIELSHGILAGSTPTCYDAPCHTIHPAEAPGRTSLRLHTLAYPHPHSQCLQAWTQPKL